MRWLLIACGLAGCDLYFPPSSSHSSDAMDTPCPSGAGANPVACITPGASCEAEGKNQDACICACGNDDWLHCSSDVDPGTCYDVVPLDAGVAASPACGAIEAESAASYPGWAISPVPWTHGGAELSANVAGASFQLPFTGTAVVLYYEEGPDRGDLTIRIDDGSAVVVDATASGDFTWGNATTIASGLPAGPHTATITCATLACDVDYLDVACPAM